MNADVNHENRLEETPICYAARYGYIDVYKYLLSHGAKLDPYMHKINPYIRDRTISDEEVYGHADVAMIEELIHQGLDIN